MNFRSDNEAPIAPAILDAITRANAGNAHAYGYDAYTEQLNNAFSRLFDHEVYVLAMTSGTAANAIALANMCPAYGAVFCHEEAHILVDECGAVGQYGAGLQLIPIAGDGGKLTAQALQQRLGWFGVKGDHEPQASAVSITQATECGTVYQAWEVAALAKTATEHGVTLHMDGARFANAVAHLGCHPGDITHRAGVDVLSFGATKNGAMNAEAIVVFNSRLVEGLRRRRMKGGHLHSKMRYVSAQLLACIEDNLWLTLAQQANGAASRLAAAIESASDARLAYPCEANEVFAYLEPTAAERLTAAGFGFHPWPGTDGMYRFVVPWNVAEESVDRFEQTVVHT